MQLYNKVNSKELKEQMLKSSEERITLSFYKYHVLEFPNIFRDQLYLKWAPLGVFGRIYVANEGINGQISVPEAHWEEFKQSIEETDVLRGIRLNIAVEDDGKSFFKLIIKVRKKIVADGLESPVDLSYGGVHLKAKEFNEVTDDPEAIIIDMRNHYEAEVGHFENAICPEAENFRDLIPEVEALLKGKEDKPVVMYCTGGIRCEKATAYFKQKGVENIYQLEGGIINYAHQVEEQGLRNKFHGKNFVFDERLGEHISCEVISVCHQCGKPADTHTNCVNAACHILFIQCEECARKYEGCCSDECKDVIHLPEDEQKEIRRKSGKGRKVFRMGMEHPVLGKFAEQKVDA